MFLGFGYFIAAMSIQDYNVYFLHACLDKS